MLLLCVFGPVDSIFIFYRRDFIAELISQTKQVRHDKKLARDEHEDITARLDESWNKIRQMDVMSSLIRPVKDKSNLILPGKDDYDQLASPYSKI